MATRRPAVRRRTPRSRGQGMQSRGPLPLNRRTMRGRGRAVSPAAGRPGRLAAATGRAAPDAEILDARPFPASCRRHRGIRPGNSPATRPAPLGEFHMDVYTSVSAIVDRPSRRPIRLPWPTHTAASACLAATQQSITRHTPAIRRRIDRAAGRRHPFRPGKPRTDSRRGAAPVLAFAPSDATCPVGGHSSPFRRISQPMRSAAVMLPTPFPCPAP